MPSTTINRLGTLNASIVHYRERMVSEAPSSPGIELASQTLLELSGDLQSVIDSERVPHDGETWRASMASLLIAVGYVAGSFLEKAKAEGTDFEDAAFESQILIACSYLEAAVSLILAAAVTGQESLVAIQG